MFPFIYNNTGITDDKVLHFIFAFWLTAIFYFLLKKINKWYFDSEFPMYFIPFNFSKLNNLFYKFRNIKFYNKLSEIKIFIIIFLILLILGIWKEIKDFYTPWRNVEILDIITNYIWMGFFYFLVYIKTKITKLFNKN